MDSIIIDWPANLKISDRSDPQLIFNNRSAGEGLDGSEQILSPLSERWAWSSIIVPIRNAGQARSLRVVKSRLKGRFNYLRMPLCDQYRITRKDIGASYPGPAVPHSDDTFFSDGSGYALASPKARVSSGRSAGNSQLILRASDFNGAMTAGVFFTLNGWLYHVDYWEPFDGGSVNYILDISPPLREAVVAGEYADFSAPAIWQLDGDAVGGLDLTIGRLGSVQLSLIEPVGRRP